MHNFQPADFQDMRFNVYEFELSELPALVGLFKYNGEFKEELIKYIVFMYDQRSPLQSQIPDVKKRRNTAAELSGLTKSPKAFMQDVFDFKVHGIVDMVFDYLVFQKSRLWSMIVTNEQTFYEYQYRLLRPIEESEDRDDKNILQATQIKTKLMEDCDKIHERLEAYYSKFFENDKVLIERVQRTGIKIYSPEGVAQANRNV